MKTLYTTSVLLIIILASAFVGYGIYLNTISDSYIAESLARRVVKVHCAPVKIRTINPEITLGGINLQTDHMADVISQIDGSLSAIQVERGQRVEIGQTLCELDNGIIPLLISRSRANLNKAKSAYLQANNMLERQRRLRQEKVISLSEFEASEADFKAAEAELAASEVGLKELEQQWEHRNVSAPAAGDVLLVYHKVGSYLPKGTPLMLVGDFSTLWLQTLIPGHQMNNLLPLEEEYELIVDLEYDSKAYSTKFAEGYGRNETFTIDVVEVSPPITEPAFYRLVSWRIDNSKKIMEPGLYTDAIIRRRQSADVLSIPLEALDGRPEGKVHVVDADNRLALR
ncbi:MAG: efflux RND transporter periplasmic adaptor subunit, partial [Planctomycetes bacterium]|nr:efflux RND transporter periplasmic adaptor subunit [Planctomycetota bacterium]